MKNRENHVGIKNKAEARLSDRDKYTTETHFGNVKKLLHELQVDQIELQMQNEELKKAQSVIEESRSRYAELYDQAPVGYFTFDKDGMITEANLTGATMLGFDRKQLINRPFSFFVTPPYKDVFYKHYRQALATGRKERCELELKTRPGTLIYTALDSVAGHHAEEPRACVRAAVLDITDKKQTETRLKQANEKLKKSVVKQKQISDALLRLEAAIEHAQEAVIVANTGWSVVYANPTACTLTGYDKSQLIGMDARTLKERLGYTDTGPAAQMAAGEECRTWTGRFSLKKKNGTTVEVEGNAAPVTDKNGTILNCILLLRDITESLQLERKLRQAQKMEAIGTFASGIAHDFNNILAGIIGFTEMVLDDTDPADPRHRRLSLILKGARRGRQLVRHILTFGRTTETGQKPIAIGGVIWDAFNLLRPSIPSTIDIRVNIKAEKDLVAGDQNQIHQVLMNLCSNAVHAMKDKGGVLEISLADVEPESHDYGRLTAIRPGAWLQLTVRDTGCGMTAEVMDRIFDPFFTTKAPGEGSGMGLSTVHGILKDHCGDIVVESETGQGSGFHLFFPSIMGNGETDVDKGVEISGGTESILFVDDEELLVEMNRERLMRLEYKVTGTTDSLEALRLFRDDPAKFDLVITDYTMPRMTGIELARELLRIRADLPIIICTGLGEETAAAAAKEAGVQCSLSKPISISEIAPLITRLLDKKGNLQGVTRNSQYETPKGGDDEGKN